MNVSEDCFKPVTPHSNFQRLVITVLAVSRIIRRHGTGRHPVRGIIPRKHFISCFAQLNCDIYAAKVVRLPHRSTDYIFHTQIKKNISKATAGGIILSPRIAYWHSASGNFGNKTRFFNLVPHFLHFSGGSGLSSFCLVSLANDSCPCHLYHGCPCFENLKHISKEGECVILI